MEVNLHDLGLGNDFSDTRPNAQQQNQTGLYQNYKLSCFTQNYKNVKKPSTERKEILANYTSDKGLNACIQNILRTPTTQ